MHGPTRIDSGAPRHTQSLINEKYKYDRKVYIREQARADGTYRHGNTTGILELNLYGNPSGTYYYLDEVLHYIWKKGYKSNDHELCLLKLNSPKGRAIITIAVDDFSVTASTPQVMDEVYKFLNRRYSVKRLGKPNRYLGCYFHYSQNGDITISQTLLVEQTLADAGMEQCNSKRTPYPDGIAYHQPSDEDTAQPRTKTKYKQLVVELRFLADCTRPDIAYVVGRLGTAAANPTNRHWSILKETLRYLAGTKDYDIRYSKTAEKKNTPTNGVTAHTESD